MNPVSTPSSPDSDYPQGGRRHRRHRSMFAAIDVRLLLVLFLAASALAAPASAAPETSTLNLSWPSLGLARTINLNAANSNQDFTVPVPAGLDPVRLHGVIHAPVNLGPGFVEISDPNGGFLGAVNLPPVTADQAVTPFTVDISAAHVRDAAIGLSFTVRQVDSTGQICGPMQQLQISDLDIDFAGTEPAPATAGTFFPPVLQRVLIYAPNDADAAEQQAVLTLASALVREYAPQPVGIAAVGQPRGATPPPTGPLTRAVVVERGPAGLNVANAGTPGAYLRLSGRGDELTAQTSLIANGLQSLAQVDAARVYQAGSGPTPSGDTLTFDELGMKGRAEVLRSGDMSVTTDRAALGAGRIESGKVHLLAEYTPVAKEDAATVMVRANGIVVHTQALDQTGRLDTTFDLPTETLTQQVALDFAITYSPRQLCGPMIAPLTFQVSPKSTLTVKRGGPAPGGFSALPSEFSPKFYVALDGTGSDQLGYATRLLTDIARQTKAQLLPQVVDVKAAAEASDAALIVANADNLKHTTLNPPLSGAGAAITVDLPTQLRADITKGLGSVQVFADKPRNRTVALVTTTDSWALVDPLIDYLDRPDAGWTQLTGDVLAAGAAGVPVNVSIHGEDASGLSDLGGGGHGLQIAGTIALALMAALGGLLLWRRRSRGPRPK